MVVGCGRQPCVQGSCRPHPSFSCSTCSSSVRAAPCRELEAEVDMTRIGVMKHLRLLEEAELVVTRRSGREKLHFLNPVPIRLIHDRWIGKYTERQVSALANLKADLEARR